MDIYDRITKLLSERNITRKKMASDLGISYSTINSLYARRTERIKFEMVEQIASYLGTTTDYLAFGNSSIPTPIGNVNVINEQILGLTPEELEKVVEYILFIKSQRKIK